jgi:hypothetical protein
VKDKNAGIGELGDGPESYNNTQADWVPRKIHEFDEQNKSLEKNW